SLNKVLAENFVERGGGRRQAGACQVRQQSYTEFSATDVKGFYLKLVLRGGFRFFAIISKLDSDIFTGMMYNTATK
ncbi:MAG: hypothetical protein IJI50_09470, partial [Ruminococcus sp.]|nr:hypothetical protein [Ruminococcus sp.]